MQKKVYKSRFLQDSLNHANLLTPFFSVTTFRTSFASKSGLSTQTSTVEAITSSDAILAYDASITHDDATQLIRRYAAAHDVTQVTSDGSITPIVQPIFHVNANGSKAIVHHSRVEAIPPGSPRVHRNPRQGVKLSL